MKPKIKQKWVEALRSGEYSQGKFKLYDGTNYCCLGVLCNLYLNEKNEDWYYLANGVGNYYCDGQSETLPQFVMDWAELDRHDPLVSVESNNLDKTSISGLNDDLNYTFAQIADVIEAQF